MAERHWLSVEERKAAPRLAPNDEDIILRFAKGDLALREQAIAIHRRYLPKIGARANAFMEFMAEVDNVSPDYFLRALYRKRLYSGEVEPLHGI